MEIVHIFEAPDCSSEGLYSVQYSKNEENIFEKLFKDWFDPEYMFNYCKENLVDIQNKFGFRITAGEAANELMDEAESLRDLLLKASFNSLIGNNLQSIFKPLNNNDYRLTILQHSKASAKGRLWKDPKLRIYALRIEANTYVVTGGAIKLTDTMKERDHTMAELVNLRMVYEWLKGVGIEYSEDLKTLL